MGGARPETRNSREDSGRLTMKGAKPSFGFVIMPEGLQGRSRGSHVEKVLQ